jgi:putative peptide zinc metalloprotease protein
MNSTSATVSSERDVLAAPPPRPAVDGVPVRADGVELLGPVSGSGHRLPPALVRRGDGQTIQLTPLLYQVLVAIDGRRDHDEIAAHVSTAIDRLVSADNVRVLLDKLRPLGLLAGSDGSQPEVRKTNPLLSLRFRFVVTDPRMTRRITAPFAFLFRPVILAAVVLGFVAVGYWVLFEKGLASATYHALHQPGLLLLVVAVTIVSAGFHELGHAAAAHYGGAAPGAMGAGLYLIWPAFYTDVTDSYRLGRGGRLRTDLGGLYFNAIVAVAMFGVWTASHWDALLLIIATQLLQMIRQLTPLVRFDGYHVLADLTGVPDLYLRVGPTLRGLLPNHWGDPETKALKPWARAVVTVWVLLVVPLLLLSLILMVVVLPRVVATAWESLGRQWAGLHGAFGDGDVTVVAVRALAIVAIALPLLGIGYLLVQLVRRVSGRVWRATEGRPGRRSVAGLVAVGILAALAWAWWPDGNTYRPIQPNERGTILDVTANATGTRPVAEPGAPAWGSTPAGAEARRPVSARTIWPQDAARPTADQPELAVVMTPRSPTDASGRPAPTWVFPFDRPLAPRPGDNQALAVNTTDGSTVYDVSFALVWVTDDTADGTVDNRNEAYALANCQDCTTVAVGFQVLLVVGQADVVVPQNLSAAVNYACVECVTVALAKQLVITVPENLSEATVAELTRLWARLEELAGRITSLSLQQIQEELSRVETEIVEIIQRDPAVAPGQGGGADSPDQPGTTTPPASNSTTQPPAQPTPTQTPTTSDTPPSSGPSTPETTAETTDPPPSS